MFRVSSGNGLQLATLLSRVVTPYEGLFNPLKRLLTICRIILQFEVIMRLFLINKQLEQEIT